MGEKGGLSVAERRREFETAGSVLDMPSVDANYSVTQ